MKKTREQRRAELQARANELIEQLLDWTEQTEQPNLTQIEDIVLELRQELGESMVANVLSAQEAAQPVQATCPECGRELRTKGARPGQVLSRVGEIQLGRGYYYCPACQTGFFPPGSPTGAAG
jgi:uncharacterized protein with PIN domain